MAENPYQSPQTELSPVQSTIWLRLTGWCFLGLGAFFFFPLAAVAPLLVALGEITVLPAAISAVFVIGCGALSIWVGNRFRRRANLPPSQWPPINPVVASAGSAYTTIGFLLGTAIAVPFILSVDPLDKLIGGVLYGGIPSMLIGFLLGMRHRP